MNEPGNTTTTRCPHCGTVADVEPARGLRFRCLVCGGPRVPIDAPGAEVEPRATRALERANRLRFRLAAWRLGTALIGAFGLLSAGVAALALALTSPGLVPLLLTLLTVAVPLAVAAHGWGRTRELQRELEADLDEAWRFTSLEALRAGAGQGRLDAEGVARALRIDEVRAEQLLADLEVHDLASSEVGADGKIAYFALSPPRRRVAMGDLGLDGHEPPGESARAEQVEDDARSGQPHTERRGQRA